jgi:predicted DNA-binding helix-hairpin-helix protein
MRFRFAKTLCVYILALGKRRKLILKVKLHLHDDFHVHRVTGTYYSPILACSMRVREKPDIFENSKSTFLLAVFK